jgi:predicted enzyme related to lactoylglutathione lyase
MLIFNKKSMSQQKPKVTGIGGIFFKTEDPEKLKKWYGEHLGLAISPHGSSFEFRNAHRPDEINYLSWGTFPKDTDYFAPSKKDFMINYRVNNIESLVENLRNAGVIILDEITEYSYGKFVHIMDPEGNNVELWEPIDHVFTEMGGETTK